jgi:hypothetical protein
LENDWAAAAHNVAANVQPVNAVWHSLTSVLSGASSAEWIAHSKAVCAAARALGAVSGAVRLTERRIKRTFYLGLQPMMQAAAHLLREGTQQGMQCAASLGALSLALTAAVLAMLPEMTEAEAEAATSACLVATGANLLPWPAAHDAQEHEGGQQGVQCAAAFGAQFSALNAAVLAMRPKMTEAKTEAATPACLIIPGASTVLGFCFCSRVKSVRYATQRRELPQLCDKYNKLSATIHHCFECITAGRNFFLRCRAVAFNKNTCCDINSLQ